MLLMHIRGNQTNLQLRADIQLFLSVKNIISQLTYNQFGHTHIIIGHMLVYEPRPSKLSHGLHVNHYSKRRSH